MNVFFFLAIVVVLALGVLAIFPKPRAFMVKHWKGLAGLVLGLVGAGAAEQTFELLKEAVLGKAPAETQKKFTPIDATHVIVEVGGAWKSVPLPAGVRSDKVTAVAVDAGGQATVEVQNAPIDKT